ncbi:uncharacterized protein B0495.5-like isoform X1 [Teleopsis dalmanni]|uniref:uncharacterized protein B0495.5-like isoform X1 n=2 Tax=Teleopsis dalmanni TaxID=139649 RepID=UPI0018CFE488|nr:uncharacterized protein B0495.5-like isoform X1 [Teleopsis dalmanni]
MFKNICRCSNNLIRKSSTAANPPKHIPLTINTKNSSCSKTTTTQKEKGLSLQATNHSYFTRTSLIRSMSTEAVSAVPKHTNRLAKEKSPYLLQHAHNPVDWYPWGEEAIERARAEKKLIFLSVGYSTCHWCHVMERESFENEDVAKILNSNFISIKVDREERPDIDKIYMQFVLMINGHGGWPMSVWLTPDLAPLAAGTYFPPVNHRGVPSFSNVLKTILSRWESNEQQLNSTGKEIIATLRKQLTEKQSEQVFEPNSADHVLKEALNIFKQRYDRHYGGFGSRPKFPEVSRLNFLFHAYIVTKDTDVLDMVLQTLYHIGDGGIHDHVFGGFARYSVDSEWHVPHFEKMLYDQGQLMAAYANAYKLTRDEYFLRRADDTFRYLIKDLRHPLGGFFAGEDADSLPTFNDAVKVEGAFYAWTFDEVKEAVMTNEKLYGNFDANRAFEIYSFHYSMLPAGNVQPSSDPQGHLKGKNILIVKDSEKDTCKKFEITVEQLQLILNTTNDILHGIRDKRPRPHLDTKIITAWNGLVLSGLAKLSNCGSSKREEYMNAAKKLVDFIKTNLFDAKHKKLFRSCYGIDVNNEKLNIEEMENIYGFLDDYAFLIKGLLDYYKSSLDINALQWAIELQDIQDTLFWDDNHGGYFYSEAESPNVVVRLKEDHDGAEPCGNSVTARNLILLSHYFDKDTYQKRAAKLFDFFADVKPFGYTLPEMTSALFLHEFGLDLVAVVGPDSETTKRFVEICRKFYIPGMIILHVDPQHPDDSYNERVQNKFKMINGKPTVYICHDRVCRMPVTDPAVLEENLKENFFRVEL